MTGAEHYRKAEQLAASSEYRLGRWEDADQADQLALASALAARAQVHATLAVAAATALNDGEKGLTDAEWGAWRAAAGPEGATS
jgi:hypothetical protein